MKKKTNYLLLIVMVLSFGIGIFALGHLVQSYLEYKKGSDTYDDLQNYVEEPDDGNNSNPDKNPEKPEAQGELTDEFSYLQVDFRGLKEINADVIAWVQIPVLDISYPVVQGADNTFYLSHLFSGEKNINGSIFVDYHNKPDFSDQNTIIYGHNMRNGSMFGTLSNYENREVYQQNPYLYIYLPEYVLKYQVFSCYAARPGSAAYTYTFPTAEDFDAFTNAIRNYAAYPTEVEIGKSDKIVTLSTCVSTQKNLRYLIHGKLVEKIGGNNK